MERRAFLAIYLILIVLASGVLIAPDVPPNLGTVFIDGKQYVIRAMRPTTVTVSRGHGTP